MMHLHKLSVSFLIVSISLLLGGYAEAINVESASKEQVALMAQP
ncbi:MAG: hypothetical protein U9R17_07560 [Thermodesulfobacteriota bacterium]|nr:hypothetical protein [Thermodesulfobacteriota bacterium]